MGLNINATIKEFRERIEVLQNDRKKLEEYIQQMNVKVREYNSKYFEILRITDYLKYIIANNHFSEIEVERVYTYSNDNEKVYLMKFEPKNNLAVQRVAEIVNSALDYYKDQTLEYSRIIQLHINKLELLETTYYKLLYSIEYLEFGTQAIDINNDMGYGYYFYGYYNNLTGFGSSINKFDLVRFTKEEIEKFIFTNIGVD